MLIQPDHDRARSRFGYCHSSFRFGSPCLAPQPTVASFTIGVHPNRVMFAHAEPHTVIEVQGIPDHEQRVALNGDGYFSGARLLISDARVAVLLIDEARDRAVERVFGVPRDQSFLVTVIALGTLAGAVHRMAEKILSGPNPSLGDTVIGVAVVKAAVQGVAGDSSKGSPLFGTLVVISVLGAKFRPTVRASFRHIKAASHRARLDFDHRYGHLIPPARRRG